MSESIRLLETDNKRKGNLFGRLAADVFVALGYEYPRLNIHKSGREVDLSAEHRYEPRRAVGECKATAEPIGGDALNKFAGVVDAEFDENIPVVGYFISLTGFTEAALEQERQRRRTRIVTLTGPQVVDRLIQGRIIISTERATELAGRCCAGREHLMLDSDRELLAHEKGWIRTIYYTEGKARTHYALLHADGTLLRRAIVDEVVASDRACGGTLHQLTCLNAAAAVRGPEGNLAEALAAHAEYVSNECGFLHLDGLPADTEVGSRRLRLENLFVPLKLTLSTGDGDKSRSDDKAVAQPVGIVLETHPRLALLSPPGAGKSTLLKRLASAYIDPARRGEIGDGLPDRKWLPLFFRCRELRGLARGSFAELLNALSQREPIRRHAATFLTHVDRELIAGRVLLLIDGLDEISDPGDRAAFVCMLRTVLQAYPGVAMVLTSREAGYRHVASHLMSTCTGATLAPFDDDAIRRLTVDWHRETIADTEKVKVDAGQLAETIVKIDRIRRLAVNPLLLTTLLLVKRWVGTLPTRRAVLYGKAVEMLLMTWNTEGHEPIPEEEALPQLCYVASAMMIENVQKISRPRLSKLLHEARQALPTELGYVQGTVEHFINRVEERSSVLMMSGHDVEDGRLVEFFEFRHLTFQEFLTARAFVEGWHRNRVEEDTLATVLTPFFEREDWGEVIPLAAALGGKAAELLLQQLTTKLREIKAPRTPSAPKLFLVLLRCLADETPARPESIHSAVRELVRFGLALFHQPQLMPELLRGRYGKDMIAETRNRYRAAADDSVSARFAMLATTWYQMDHLEDNALSELAVAMLASQVSEGRCEGALAVVGHCLVRVESKFSQEQAQPFAASLVEMLFSDVEAEHYAAAWALALLGAEGLVTMGPAPDARGRLFVLWKSSRDPHIGRIAASAFTRQPLDFAKRDQHFSSVSPELLEEALDDFAPKTAHDLVVLAMTAWYVGRLSDVDLYEQVERLRSRETLMGSETEVLVSLRKQLRPRVPLRARAVFKKREK